MNMMWFLSIISPIPGTSQLVRFLGFSGISGNTIYDVLPSVVFYCYLHTYISFYNMYF